MSGDRQLSERALIFVLGAVQFANILDFMMVMPLGADFARDLGIPASRLGWIGGSYTASAALAGLLGSFWLERFDRRPALVVSMLGLAVGTVAGAFATGLPTLLAARVLAGFWGGPATALAMSILADVVPPERRGKAMGAVMGAFAAASVLGVPAGLELARRGTWRTPFLAVALLGVAIACAAWWVLPPLRGHLARASDAAGLGMLLRRPAVRQALLLTTLLMGGSFCLVPHIASYVQLNLGFPRAHLGSMYLIGGVVSFVATRVAGRWVDRWGPFVVGTVGAAMVLAVVTAGFAVTPSWLPVPALFLTFFLANGLRNVPFNTLMTLVPQANERAAFLSLQSATQHLAAALGAGLSSLLLATSADGALVGMPRVAVVAMLANVAVVPVMLALTRRLAQVR